VSDAELEAVVVDLARRLREVVLPALGSHAGRAHVGGGAGAGDVTFAIDERAEAEVERTLAERAPEVAVYTEDRGLSVPDGGAEHVLVVDPIDGTRPAMAGFEAACVSVALAPFAEGAPTMGDVSLGVVVEIKSGASFVGRRGRGLEADVPVAPSANVDLERLFWVYGLRGRPVRLYAEVLGDLLDGASVGGGTFDLGAATFDMTRVATGQLDAYVEPGPLVIERIPEARAEFERVGGGSVLNNAPYDLAAAALCAAEAGCVVTDAAGRPLSDRPLLGSGHEYQMSVIASGNEELHGALVDAVRAGIDRVRGSLGRAQ
jgi:myo-inositol-1(or 4)-monophosphatase